MLRFYNNTPKINSSRRTMFSRMPNIPLYERQKWSREPVSLHLDRFLTKYFHPYHFLISTNNSFNNFSTLLFDVTPIQNNDNHSGNYLKYEVSPTFDPAIKLLNQITNSDNLDIGFKVHSIGKEPLRIYLPGIFLPTHFSLRIRDAIEDQKIKTATNINDLNGSNHEQKSKIIKYPFESSLDTNQMSTLKGVDSCIADLKELLKEDRRQRQIKITNIINCWNKFSQAEQENMLNMFYHDYYKLYVDGPFHINTMKFNVHDKNWNLASLNSVPDIKNPVHATNTAAQLIQFSQYRHSSVHGYHVSFTCGGALSINNFCPGIDFLKDIGYQLHHDSCGVHVAMRHSHQYDHTKPVDSDDHHIDVLYPFNGFIPYWMIIYFKESCDAFGIKTSGLIMPKEMQKMSNEENNTYLKPTRG